MRRSCDKAKEKKEKKSDNKTEALIVINCIFPRFNIRPIRIA
jgi:hypothetical protein